MFENVDGRTDGRRTDGRTTDAGVTGILIAHLGAFGSGELKKRAQISYKSKCYWSQFTILKGNLIKVILITQ